MELPSQLHLCKARKSFNAATQDLTPHHSTTHIISVHDTSSRVLPFMLPYDVANRPSTVGAAIFDLREHRIPTIVAVFHDEERKRGFG